MSYYNLMPKELRDKLKDAPGKAWENIKSDFNDFWKKLSNPGDINSPGFFDALVNKFTGNIDYARNVALQQGAQSFNAEEAQKQRDYEMKLANTAYQRQAADLSAAGFNPALAVGAGGAFTPSGAAASSPSAHYSDNTKGFEMLLNALVAGLSLGIKSSQTAAAVALSEEKGKYLRSTRLDKSDYLANAAYRNFAQAQYYERKRN